MSSEPLKTKSVFSQNLCTARKLKGWTQNEAAINARITRSTWAAYEEDRHSPPIEVLTSIAEALNIEDDLYWFINNIDFFDEKGRRRNVKKLTDFEKKYHSLESHIKRAVDALMNINVASGQ